jgi:tRNA dimethylallyltransferase
MNIKKDLTSFLKSAKKPLVVVVGATASGKTKISLEIADFINGEIISTDSRQIYKEMDIATDIIPVEERKGIPHHMIAITTPEKTIDLPKYKEVALQKIEEIYERKHIPMLVGGTGLYISAIIEGYTLPKIPPNQKLREALTAEARTKGAEYVHEKLKKLDEKAAENIHPNNIRYVIRAIEIAKSKTKPTKQKSPFDVFLIGITRPRQEIYEKINKRVDEQIERGLVKEVSALLKNGYDELLPSMTSLGVKEIIPYIKGEMTIEECTEILKRNTRRYAKRQMTWLKRYDNVKWLNFENDKEDTEKSGGTG